MTTFEFTNIERPGAKVVSVHVYANGEFGVQCGSEDLVVASVDDISSCASDLRYPVLERDANLTVMQMKLVEADGDFTSLFVCDR